MRSLFVALALLFSISLGMAQQKTIKKKAATTARKATTTVKKEAAKPISSTLTRYQSTTSAPLEFPSTEATNEPLDPVKKQQMYDELHGVKANPVTPETPTGKNSRNSRKAKDAATQTGMGQPADGRGTAETATRAGSYNAERNTEEAKTYIGVRAGGNYTTFLDATGVDPIYGFHGGIVFLFGRGGIAFQPEINFNQDYTKVLDAGSLRLVSQPTSSLVVPLLVKFQFGQQGHPRFFVNVGPYGTYALKASTTALSYGGALGIGIGLPMGPGKFTVEARGYYALGDNSGASFSDFAKFSGKPVTGQLSVGYLFPLGGR